MSDRKRLERKLQEVADNHNSLLEKEQRLTEELNLVREQRVQAFGSATALNELLQEIIADESLGKLNGSSLVTVGEENAN